MTTDARAFLGHLATDPNNEFTRDVFADWLTERDDRELWLAVLADRPGETVLRRRYADWLDGLGEQAEAGRQRAMVTGYEAMAKLGRRLFDSDTKTHAWMGSYYVDWTETSYEIPRDWYEMVELDGKGDGYIPDFRKRPTCLPHEVLDAVALAFAKLSPERQAELLATEVPA